MSIGACCTKNYIVFAHDLLRPTRRGSTINGFCASNNVGIAINRRQIDILEFFTLSILPSDILRFFHKQLTSSHEPCPLRTKRCNQLINPTHPRFFPLFFCCITFTIVRDCYHIKLLAAALRSVFCVPRCGMSNPLLIIETARRLQGVVLTVAGQSHDQWRPRRTPLLDHAAAACGSHHGSPSRSATMASPICFLGVGLSCKRCGQCHD